MYKTDSDKPDDVKTFVTMETISGSGCFKVKNNSHNQFSSFWRALTFLEWVLPEETSIVLPDT